MAVSVPTTIAEAVRLLGEDPSATLLAGGTDLVVEINAGHRRVEHVIAIDRVAALRDWRVSADGTSVWLGSGVPYREIVNGSLSTLLPALSQASRTVGSPQIRNAGTVGGNLGTCSPAGDTLPVLAALEAQVHLESVEGQRVLPFGEYMTGVKRTARRPNELITGVTLPVTSGWQGYSKVGVRNAMVIATASSCLAADADAHLVKVALGSVGPVIIRCTEAESWVAEHIDWSERSVADDIANEFGRRCAEAARPIDDHRSTAAYRRRAIEVLCRRQLRRAFPHA